MALEILLDNMRIGHGSSAPLNLAGVIQVGGDAFQLQTPSPIDVHDVYVNLLQQPPD